ncbi:putative membrane protein YvbJ [Salirhabdus euzebyi]|uniref:Putative membrane protein YvbJ n=1 Tax=Salirhabdus euzebyi TaxID=394506 RepID=A0A841Q6X9_9BACI|nr:zinc-ribbon domain-containing protein [Salirhabdus euzebyi]MBB6454104.1 putative membrane protein YvbJ [Salirhabdus euzebyi]
MFCTSCGQEVKKDAKFCTVCGSNIIKKQEMVIHKENRSSKNQKRKWTKKQKIGITSLLGALVFIIAAYFLIDYFTDKDRTIDAFEEAVRNKNLGEMVSILNSSDEKFVIKEETVQPFLDWLSENPDNAVDIVSSLQTQATALDQKGEVTAIGEVQELIQNNVIALKKDGKFLGLFDQYQLEVNPVYMDLSSSYGGTTFFLGDQELGTLQSDGDTVRSGPLLPGYYTFIAKLTSDFVELEKEETLEVTGTQDNYFSFSLDAEEVYVTTDLGALDVEAELLVNNQPVKWNLNSGNNAFGPVLTDGSMHMSIKVMFPWGEVTTEELVLDNNRIHFNILEQSQLKEDVVELSEMGLTRYLEVKANHSVNGLNQVTKDGEESILDIIQADNNNTSWVQSKPIGFEIFPASYNISLQNGQWNLYSLVRLTEEVQYSDYVEEVDTLYNMYFLFNESEQEWKLEYMDLSNSFIFDSPEKYDFSSAKTYENANYEKLSNDELSQLVERDYSNYLYSLVDAINQNNFSIVEDTLKDGSGLYLSQRDLVENLNDKGITEEVIEYKVNNITHDGNVIKIETYEKIKIFYADGSNETLEYDWIYTAEIIDNGLKFTSIE